MYVVVLLLVRRRCCFSSVMLNTKEVDKKLYLEMPKNNFCFRCHQTSNDAINTCAAYNFEKSRTTSTKLSENKDHFQVAKVDRLRTTKFFVKEIAQMTTGTIINLQKLRTT